MNFLVVQNCFFFKNLFSCEETNENVLVEGVGRKSTQKEIKGKEIKGKGRILMRKSLLSPVGHLTQPIQNMVAHILTLLQGVVNLSP